MDRGQNDDLNLTVTEPPLKKIKKELEKFANFKPEIVPVNFSQLSPHSLKVKLELDSILLTGSILEIESPLKESSLDKWRKSFQSSSTSISLLKNEIKEIELLDEFFFSDIDEQELFFESLPKYDSNRPFHRVKCLKIIESFYVIEGKKFQHPQKEVECLIIENDISNLDFPLKVFIRGDWLHSKIEEECLLNIIGPVKNGEIIIDDYENYLVIGPDILINTTGIADSFTCMRRAVLSYRNQTAVDDNKPSSSLIVGSIVHELVEASFKTGSFKEINELDPLLNSLIIKSIEKIFCCEKDEMFVKAKVIETMKNFPKWCSLYIRKFPAIHAYIQDPIKKIDRSAPSSAATICLSKILDLEENIWSTMFGLKGKVDATVILKSKKGTSYESLITPFELKTGQSTTSVNHRAQTLLYTLMLNDRYRRPIDYGLLFYITTGDLIRISSFRDEIRSILIKRNQLAEALARQDELPPQIRNEHLCKKCFQVDTCVMYHKLLEKGTKDTSSVPSLFELKTGHLDEVIGIKRDENENDEKLDTKNTKKDVTKYAKTYEKELHEEFIRKWQNLINLEEAESVKSRSELWRFSSKKRREKGKCLNEMKLIKCEEIPDSIGMNQFSSTFIKEDGNCDDLKISLLNSYLNEGDPVTITFEDTTGNVHYALATGKVYKLTGEYITIYTDRPIKVPIKPEDDLDSVEIVAESTPSYTSSFCIDKNELTGSFGLLRTSLIKLFSLEGRKLLNLIVNKTPPRYLPRVKFDETILNSLDPKYGMMKDYLKMDEYQREAFYRTIETLDYLLILGMPGTGKTTTLAFIIRYLVLILGKSILISSHTHSSIDHIALKLQEGNLPFLRIGSEDKIDKGILTENLIEKRKFSTVSEVEHCYSSSRVVICTSLGMNHSIFMRKRFDFCLIDEASQLTLPACLGSVRVAQSFVLVGDHFQLPPLVRSRDALKGGFGESLFKILAESNPNSMTKLCYQYRMNDEIMLMANRLTYNNLLKCGNDTVKDQVLRVEENGYEGCEVWLKRILNQNCKVAFLNTDNFPSCQESLNGNSFHNEGESKIIKTIVKYSIVCGVNPEQISLISPYRPQLKYLNIPEIKNNVNISTIDKYQGKDSDLVIISLVRSNSDGNIGELLNDWQRLNVAFTRAKKKLILIGSAETILNNASFKKLKDLINERDWMIDIV